MTSHRALAKLIDRDQQLFFCYQHYPFSAEDMIERLKNSKNNGLSLEQFVMLRYAKGGSFATSYKLNEGDIKRITESAFKKAISVEEAISLLLDLDGVRLAMASAIMAWVYPDKYAVVDKRVVEAAKRLNWISSVKTLNFPSYVSKDCRNKQIKIYENYIGDLKKVAQALQNPRRIQQLDVWLYNYAKRSNKKRAEAAE